MDDGLRTISENTARAGHQLLGWSWKHPNPWPFNTTVYLGRFYAQSLSFREASLPLRKPRNGFPKYHQTGMTRNNLIPRLHALASTIANAFARVIEVPPTWGHVIVTETRARTHPHRERERSFSTQG